MKLTIAGLLYVTATLAATSGLETVVKIDSGWVSGSGTTVRSYKGIPFAAPPVGDLRWKPPQPVKPWKGFLFRHLKQALGIQMLAGLIDQFEQYLALPGEAHAPLELI